MNLRGSHFLVNDIGDLIHGRCRCTFLRNMAGATAATRTISYGEESSRV
jgi:hypothetical protein